MVNEIRHHQPSHGPTVQHWGWRNRREEEPELWPSEFVRGGLRKVGHTTTASAQYPPSGMPLAENKLIRLNGYPKPCPMVVRTTKRQSVTTKEWFLFRVSSQRTPACNRQDFALSGRYARQFGPPLLISYSQLTYACAHTRTYTCIQICIYIRVHTYVHIHMPSATCGRATLLVQATCSDRKIKKQ